MNSPQTDMKTMQPFSITGLGSVSALGSEREQIWRNATAADPIFEKRIFNGKPHWVSELDATCKAFIGQLLTEKPKYKSLDPSVLYAIASARKAVEEAKWAAGDYFGINLGSSRGATQLFETHYATYLESQKTPTLSSPTTTLGNISSWVAHDLQSAGPEISHSITCSTSLHALLNGAVWLQSGLADKFLVGGSEAPLTGFTMAQLDALKIYSRETSFPCRALDLKKTRNAMVLAEAAVVAAIESGIRPNARAIVENIGFATELLENSTSISAQALCFQKSMRMAVSGIGPEAVDAIIMHAPGTLKGDLTEFRAVEKVFGKKLPLLTSTKWKTGHSFGASGMLSIALGVQMLERRQFITTPFYENPSPNRELNHILVNAVGFGGNAVSVLLKRA